MVFETTISSDLKEGVKVVQLTGNMFTGDINGNKITAAVTDNGQPVSLSGEVKGYIIRPDQKTVLVNGSISGTNKASIILPYEAYVYDGQIHIVVKVGAITVGACTAYVCRTSTDQYIDPSHVIPDIDELLAKIAACEAATVAATSAADAIDDMTVAASGLAEGASPTATVTDVSGHKHIAFGIPKGDTGYSPTATVSKTNQTVTISITDKNGTTTTTVTEPTATVSKSGTTSTITLTDSNGTHTAQVNDGATGPVGATPQLSVGTVTDVPYGTGASVTITGTAEAPVLNFSLQSGQSGNETIDDTKGLGDTDYVWSADKTAKEVIRLDGIKANTDSVYAYKEASGSLIEIDDAVAEAVKQMRIEIAPVQDLHGYDHPWAAGAGKNKWQYGNDNFDKDASTMYSNIPLSLPAGTYTVSGIFTSGDTTGNKIRITFRDDNGSLGAVKPTANSSSRSSDTITLSVPCTKVYIYGGDTTGTMYAFTATDFMIESGNTATAYVPSKNVCPISGWTGAKAHRYVKNLFDKNTATSGYVVTTSGSIVANANLGYSDYIRIDSSKTYYISHGVGSSALDTGCAYDEYYNVVGGLSLTGTTGDSSGVLSIPSGAVYIRFNMRISNYDVVQLEEGSSATTYDGSAKTYSITFPTSAGTVYGGTLTVNADGTGSLVVNKKQKTLTSADSSNLTGFGSSISNMFAYTGASSEAKTATGVMCSHLESVDTLPSGTARNGVCYCNSAGNIGLGFGNVISGTAVTDLTAYLDAQNTNGTPVQICYELESAVSYQLTTDQVLHLLSGVNNVWSDCGVTTLLYPTDKYLTIEQAERERIHETITVPAPVQTISDGADNLPMEMTVGIEPVQDLHGYEYPWVGGAGKNIFNKDSFTSINAYIANGFITTNAGHTLIYFSCKPNTSYVVSRKRTASNERFGIAYTKEFPANNVAIYDSHTASNTGTVGQMMSLKTTTGEDAQYVVVWAWWNSSIVEEAKDTMQIEIGESATSYEPYSNICPITGHTGVNVTRTGKNLFDPNVEYVTGKYLYLNDAETTGAGYQYTKTYIEVEPETTYAFRLNKTTTAASAMYVNFDDSNKNYISRQKIIDGSSSASIVLSGTFTTPANTKYARFSLPYGTPGIGITDIQLEKSNTVTDYEPFGQTYSITLPSEAGTVYGGTLKVNKDGSGVLTVDKASVDMGDLDWTWSSSNGYFQISKDAVNTLTGFNPARSASAYLLCSHWKQINGLNGIYQTANVYRVATGLYEGNVTTFKTAMSGATIVYEIATPVTYQLSAPIISSLLGMNNVFCKDSFQTINSIEYCASTKLYIDKKFAELQALILENL